MSLCTGGITRSKAAEKPVIPDNFSDRPRAGLWNNAAIPQIYLHEPGYPAPTPDS
jgi:hypothetical protein